MPSCALFIVQRGTCKVTPYTVESAEVTQTARKARTMARTTPRVQDALLVAAPNSADAIVVETPDWYAWLEQATSFAFDGVQGRFTARKERRGKLGWYWKAYRKQAGLVHSAYLGKSADLTLERLHTVASDLAQHATAAPAAKS